MAATFSPASEYTQENRRLRIETGLGEDELLLRRFHGVEGISQLFHFDLDLLSHNGTISPQDIVGENVAIIIESDDDKPRILNGFVKAFQYAGLEGRGLYQYKAEVVPWLWFLDKTSDCRVFQNQTVKQILESIFAELGFSDYSFALNETYEPLEYCVQYGETDYNFVCRLLESAGIFYYFEHQPKKHVLHLCDASSAYAKLSEPSLIHSSGNRLDYYINAWQHRFQYCSGAYAQSDFDFEKFNQSLVTETSSAVKLANNSVFTRYDYPGNYKDSDKGRNLTTLRMQQEEMNYEKVRAASNIHFLEIAKTFSLESEENEADKGASFVITEIHHAGSNPSYLDDQEAGQVYSNQFCCIPSAITFRPMSITPKPKMEGVQTAVVVGKSGDEIYTDKYGRIKLQFHWDRYGNRDEKSSCWVRVATQWSGPKWGTIGIPRVGQEVVVTFVNGDPDQPLVIGSVYNSANMPPFPLPAGKTVAGMKSRSTSSDGSAYNEMSIDDTKDSEQIKVYAQKNYNTTVGHDLNSTTKNNATYNVDVDMASTVGGNKTALVRGNEERKVEGNQKKTVNGNQTAAVIGDVQHDVGGKVKSSVGSSEDHEVGAAQTLQVGANQSISVGANQEVSVGANHTLEVGGKQQISAAAQDISISTNATMSALDVSVKGQVQINLTVAGSSISITPMGITLSMGASSVKIDPMGVTLSGPIVKLN